MKSTKRSRRRGSASVAGSPDLDLVNASLGRAMLQAPELEAFHATLGTRSPSVLRCRRGFDVARLGFDVAPVPWYRLAYQPIGDAVARPSRTLAYAAGEYYLQDAGSLLALAACDADEPEGFQAIPLATGRDADGALQGDDVSSQTGPLICDLCASPGGKSTALVEAIGDSGFLLANEPVRSRLAPLTYNLGRTGSDRYAIASLDPERLAESLPAVFDWVIVDAPCSGQSLLARGRQSESAWHRSQIQHSCARQQRILAAAVRLLRPGGRLVYSTCTFADDENERQVDWLLEQEGFLPDPVDRLADYVSPVAPASYRLWPHRQASAGSFTARLRRRFNEPAAEDFEHSDRRPSSRGQMVSRAETGNLSAGIPLEEWYDDPSGLRLQRLDASLLAWPEDVPDWTESIAVGGPELAYRSGKTWRPSHTAAIRRVSRVRARSAFHVDDATAVQFMAGNPIAGGDIGWQVVRWNGLPLGWIKGDGRTGKNHLPTAARVLCE